MESQFAKLREYLPNQEQLLQQLGYLRDQEPKSLAWILFYTASVLYFVYWTGRVVYRLTLHPLARFPGPFLCKIGYLQQGYYEAFLNGMFVHEIAKYHRKYGMSLGFVLECWYLANCPPRLTFEPGPVVRINPNEVHIDDPSVYHEYVCPV